MKGRGTRKCRIFALRALLYYRNALITTPWEYVYLVHVQPELD